MAHEFADLLPSERVHVLPNGIADLGDRGVERPASVLFLSHLRSRKGVFDFLEAARIVRERMPDVRFVLAGEWYRDEERRRADELVGKYSLGPALRQIGGVSEEDKAQVLAQAALLAFPSREE